MTSVGTLVAASYAVKSIFQFQEISPSQTDYVAHGMSVLEGVLVQASCNIATFGIIAVELCRTITGTPCMNN